jgi:hypothetical protein
VAVTPKRGSSWTRRQQPPTYDLAYWHQPGIRTRDKLLEVLAEPSERCPSPVMCDIQCFWGQKKAKACMHSRRACWAVTCAWDFSGLENVVRFAWGAPMDQTKVLRTNQPCWTFFLFAHRLDSQLFFSFLCFLLFPSISIFISIFNLQPPSSPHMGTVSPLRRTRNQPPVRPSAHSSCTETRVPAPRVTQLFLQRFLSRRRACMNRHRWEPLSTLEILPRSGRSIFVTICDRIRAMFASFRIDGTGSCNFWRSLRFVTSCNRDVVQKYTGIRRRHSPSNELPTTRRPSIGYPEPN